MWSAESSQSMRISTVSVNKSLSIAKANQSEYCTVKSSEFHGRITINTTEISMKELEKKYQYLKAGGHYIPQDCKARNRVSISVG
ncbi:hypothetical protein KIN20_007015 [Parelaphostrongylus tenuis]|uniref:Galactosyltransferase N-terminal domain-containing protein n=1 Tax=Parelaphostrongylus tenuis TaxID=148309 RepID=A0AAD5QGI0_PARTN|nr:hypothetical protein KIN20_007015 [Parelaphostrongylus tenuis]